MLGLTASSPLSSTRIPLSAPKAAAADPPKEQESKTQESKPAAKEEKAAAPEPSKAAEAPVKKESAPKKEEPKKKDTNEEEVKPVGDRTETRVSTIISDCWLSRETKSSSRFMDRGAHPTQLELTSSPMHARPSLLRSSPGQDVAYASANR